MALFLSTAAQAEELRIAIKATVDGADPYQLFAANRNVQVQVYEALVGQDQYLNPTPGLAESWRNIDPLTWEFVLAPGIKFADGTPLKPSDVVHSIKLAKSAQGVRTFINSVRMVESVEIKDDRTLIVRTNVPSPTLPLSLSAIAITSEAAAGEAPTAEDWNGGKAAVGTGPYRWVRWTPSENVVLERNPNWRGEPPHWDRITYRFIPNDSARVAALLSGDVDLIDAVPAELFERVETSANAKLVSSPMGYMNIMFLDLLREQTPFIKGPNGEDIPNPLRDARVRQAIDVAIDRQILAERAMQGGATASSQFSAPGLDGYVKDIGVVPHDPELARKLLAEAGYPDGFSMTIHCTNDRFSGDARSCQAVGQMLNAVGIKASVEPMPISVFTRRRNANEFSAYIAMFFPSSGLLSDGLNIHSRTQDKERGYGRDNWNFSDPELDAMLAKIDDTFDPEERKALVEQLAHRAVDLKARLPLFAVNANWAIRKDLEMLPRANGYTMAVTVTPAAQ